MAEVLLLHHSQGLTSGVRDFAATLEGAGHTIHVPDLYDGRTFDSVEVGVAHARELGFGTIGDRAKAVAEGLPAELVYAGFSLGVMAAQDLAQNRAGAQGGLFFESFVPPSEFGGEWPQGVPVQIHGMDADPFFAGDGDIDAARAFVAATDGAELFVYPGDQHLFADNSLSSYDERAAALLTERVLAFLDRIG